MKATRLLASAAALSISLAACGGHSSSPILPSSSTPGTPVKNVVPGGTSTFAFGGKLLQQSTLVKNVDSGVINVQALVTLRDPKGLMQYAQDVSNSKSGSYHRFLTPAQIADRFGASQSDYNKAAGFFAKNGIKVGMWPQRQTLTLTGSVQKFSKLLGVTFAIYRHGSDQFIAPVGTPSLAAGVPVTAISGLIGAKLSKTLSVRPSNAAIYGNSPQQMARAFDYSGAYKKFDGTGVNVAIVGTGPIDPNDSAQFGTMFHARMANLTQVPVTDTDMCAAVSAEGQDEYSYCASPSPAPSPTATPSGNYTPNPNPTATGVPAYEDNYPISGWSTPPPVTPNTTCVLANDPWANPASCNGEDGEAQLDTQTVQSLAPGSNVLFYLGYWSTTSSCWWGGTCYYSLEGLSAADAEIQEIIAQNQADVVSLSYGLGETDAIDYYFDQAGVGFGPVEFATMASEGMAVFVSSGDWGQYNCDWWRGNFCASYPASDPSVTAVGGVTAPLNADGTIKQEITAWGDQSMGSSGYGSGGGISQVFVAPPWQQKANLPGTNGYRGVPDVSLMGDPSSGMTIVTDNQGTFDVGGTSMAAPQMAAMWALVLQACAADAKCATEYATTAASGTHVRMGNAAPYFYDIYGNTSEAPKTLFDVLYGSVTYQNNCTPYVCQTPPPSANAMTGWDEMTGVGVPFAGHLINAVLTNVGGTSPDLP